MYIRGVGGTGKSHVIKSINSLFEKLERKNELLIGAPTGIAAILIGGYTIHALTMLPSSNKPNFKELRKMWRYVRYLIIDEVSMISAILMSEISDRLRQAKGEDTRVSNQLFGGVNIIFTGDFGQLKPVLQAALYKHSLVQHPGFEEVRNPDRVSTLNGAFLWRQVNKVVILKQNRCQKNDRGYSQLLDRIRVGRSYQTMMRKTDADVDILRDRQLSHIAQTKPDDLLNFADAPVIVGTRKIRDAINAHMITQHANKERSIVNLYYLKDFVSKQHTRGEVRNQLWKLSSSMTDNVMGRLPLFIGMKVMVTCNLAISKRVVNGSEGIVKEIKYDTDEDGYRYASVVYILLPGTGKLAPDLDDNVIPIFPERHSFRIRISSSDQMAYRYVSRLQIPLVPAYAYTDYKSQGHSLEYAIVDLASARSLQGVYVMLSRVRSIQGLGILRWFPAHKIHQRPAEDLQNKLLRLEHLDGLTTQWYHSR